MIKTDKRIEQLKESNKELRKRLKKSARIIRKHVISKYLYHGRSLEISEYIELTREEYNELMDLLEKHIRSDENV